MNPELETHLINTYEYDLMTGEIKHKRFNRAINTLNSYGYIIISAFFNKKKVMIFGHRLAWFLHYQEWPQSELDHINQIKTDNRISNLREATRSNNSANRSKLSNCTSSKYKGVYWYKPRQKWRAQIYINNKHVYLGHFLNEDSAALAYDAKAKELFGEYAKLNFPEGIQQ